jgi:hypothetical protein
MSGFPGSPRLIKGGIVLLDPSSGAVQRVIALQYNPDTLTRSFQVQATGGESGDRTEALRLKGPPVESYKLDAEIDLTDQMEQGTNTELGLHLKLAALETLTYPSSGQLERNNALSQARQLEIILHASTAHAFCLEQKPHRAHAPHRVQHHRRSLRPVSQSHPRQSESRNART